MVGRSYSGYQVITSAVILGAMYDGSKDSDGLRAGLIQDTVEYFNTETSIQSVSLGNIKVLFE